MDFIKYLKTVGKFVSSGERMVGFVTVTPEIADIFLSQNQNNRRVKPSVVARYAQDMKEDRWDDSMNVIAFGTDGIMTNGQHRCLAIIKSGKSEECVVGISKGFNYDTSTARSGGDLALGEDETTKRLCGITSIFSTAMFIAAKFSPHHANISKTETIAFIREHPAPFEWLEHSNWKTKRTKGICGCGVGAAMVMAYENGIDQDLLDRFDTVLMNGLSNCDREAPIIRLRNWLINPSFINGSRQSRAESYMRTQYAIEMYRKGNAKALCKPANTEFYNKWRGAIPYDT